MGIQKILSFFRKRKEASPRFSAVVVAAGSSQRMGTDKITMELDGVPVLIRSLRAFENCDLADEIVVVTRNDKLADIADLCREHGITKVSQVVSGGNTRMESALAGVSATKKKAKLIAIHDGARPLVTEDVIRRTAYAARDFYAAVPAIASTDTLKKVDEKGIVIAPVDRDRTVRLQTPQIFHGDLIKGALSYAVKKGLSLTDDCSAVELMGVKTHTVEGDADNIKLTDTRDVTLAAEILKDRR